MGQLIRFAPGGWAASGLYRYTARERLEATSAAVVAAARRFIADDLWWRARCAPLCRGRTQLEISTVPTTWPTALWNG
jgi:hypothetical protein